MRTSENIGEITAALVAARPSFGTIIKSCEVDTKKYKYKYAPFPEIIDKTEQALHYNDLYVVQSHHDKSMVSRLFHASGQWIEVYTNVEHQGVNPQGYGAALTYARRYGYMQLLGICPEDDNEQRLESDSTATVTVSNRYPPKNSRDPNWQGPMNKGELSKAAKEITAQIEDAKCVADLDAVKDSPEFKAFVDQASHDCPGFLDGERRFDEFTPGLRSEFSQRRKELKQAAEFEAKK